MEARQEPARRQDEAPVHRGLYACTGTRRRRCVERMCVRVWLCGARAWLAREGASGKRATSRIVSQHWRGEDPSERRHGWRQAGVWLAKPEPLWSVVAWGGREGGGREGEGGRGRSSEASGCGSSGGCGGQRRTPEKRENPALNRVGDVALRYVWFRYVCAGRRGGVRAGTLDHCVLFAS